MSTTASPTSTGAEDVAWDLSDVYTGPDDPALEADLEDARSSAAAFRERYAGRLTELEGAGLGEAVTELERIDGIVTRAKAYAYLHFSTNTADPARGALLQRVQEQEAALETELLFFRLEWTAIEDERAEELLADDSLEQYRHFLRALRRYRPYLLTEPEEKILTEKSLSGIAAWGRLYGELLTAVRVPLDGEETSLEEALSRLYSSDRDVRRRAAEAIAEGLAPGLRTRAYIFNTLLLDKATDDRLRGY
jgi:oligoendopeptidase F